MDNELLAKLLTTHNRLIIPGFGAFLRKEGAPAGSIVFSPFLKKDDGVLTQVLIDEYGVEHFDAETMITEWVAHIKDSLSVNNKYHIEGVGVLINDSNGALAMVAEPAKPAPKAAPRTYSPDPAQSITQPIVQQPVAAQPIVQPVAQPAPQLIAQPVPQPVAQPAPQPIAQPAPQPFTRPVIPNLNTSVGQQPRPAQPIAPRPMATISRPAPAPGTAWQQPQHPVAQNAVGSAPVGAMRPAQQKANPMQQRGQQPRPQGAGAPGRRPENGPENSGAPKKPGQNRRPAPKGKKPVELLLIIAIIAALLTTALIIYSLLTVSPTNQFYDVPV